MSIYPCRASALDQTVNAPVSNPVILALVVWGTMYMRQYSRVDKNVRLKAVKSTPLGSKSQIWLQEWVD